MSSTEVAQVMWSPAPGTEYGMYDDLEPELANLSVSPSEVGISSSASYTSSVDEKSASEVSNTNDDPTLAADNQPKKKKRTKDGPKRTRGLDLATTKPPTDIGAKLPRPGLGAPASRRIIPQTQSTATKSNTNLPPILFSRKANENYLTKFPPLNGAFKKKQSKRAVVSPSDLVLNEIIRTKQQALIDSTDQPITILKLKYRRQLVPHEAGRSVDIHIWDGVAILVFCVCHAISNRQIVQEVIKNYGQEIAEIFVEVTSGEQSKKIYYFEPSLMPFFAKCCPKLNSITFRRVVMDKLGTNACDALEELTAFYRICFDGCFLVPPATLVRLVRLNNLRELWIENTTEIQRDLCKLLADNLNDNFQLISLEGCPYVNLEGIMVFYSALERIQNMQSLTVSAVGTGVRNASLANHIRGFKDVFQYSDEVECIDLETRPGYGYTPFSVAKPGTDKTLFVQFQDLGLKYL